MKTEKLFFKMKLAIVASLLLASASLLAQTGAITGSFLNLNLKAGVNVAQIKTDAGSFNNIINESLTTQQGYVLGASLRLCKSLFIQPEVLFSQKGGQIKGVGSAIMGQVFDMSYTTLDIPVLVGYKMGRFYVLGGPLFSNQVSQNAALDQAITSVYSSYKAGDGLAKSTMAYQVGAGLSLLGLTLDVRYEAGLQNIINTSSLPSYLGALSQKPSLFQATLGFKIL
ncbi:MAG: hypothetical protein RI995_1240 [Bacteroidota bacterium]